jgi:hypothetical protein
MRDPTSMLVDILRTHIINLITLEDLQLLKNGGEDPLIHKLMLGVLVAKIMEIT